MNVVELHGCRPDAASAGCSAAGDEHLSPLSSKRHLLDAMVGRAIAGVRAPNR
jgi:hypothetical protein